MAWSVLSLRYPSLCGTILPMNKIHVVFHDGGGGHRNAAVALQTVISQQQRDWQVELIQFQDLTDRLDVLRKLAGIRIQQQYNILLQNGWTLGSTYLLRILQATIRLFHRPLVNLLERFWREKPAELLISVIPHFNRQIWESWNRVYPSRPFVTIITDLADFPPRFWIEPVKEQYVIAAMEKAGAHRWLHEGSASADACSGFSDRQTGPRHHCGSHGPQAPCIDRMQRLDASAGALQRRVGEGKGRRHCIEKFRECGGRRKAHARSSNPRQIPKKRSRSEQPRCLRNPRNSGKASRRIEFNHRTRGAGDCRSRSSLEFPDRTRWH